LLHAISVKATATSTDQIKYDAPKNGEHSPSPGEGLPALRLQSFEINSYVFNSESFSSSEHALPGCAFSRLERPTQLYRAQALRRFRAERRAIGWQAVDHPVPIKGNDSLL